MLRRALPAALIAVAALAGCSSSTLSADDQEFCAEQEEPVGYLHDEVVTMLEDDGHWASSGDAYAFQSVVLDTVDSGLRRNYQDETLDELAATLSDSIFDAQVAADEGENMDVDVLAQVRDDASALQEFCDDEG